MAENLLEPHKIIFPFNQLFFLSTIAQVEIERRPWAVPINCKHEKSLPEKFEVE